MIKRRTGIVIGLGEFGSHIAKSLSMDGCEVIAVDVREQRVNAIKDYVMKAIVADTSQQTSLQQIIPIDIDFIVVGIGNLEKSMITTLYLKDYGFDKIYVMAITDEHERILKMLGIKNVIFPEKDIALRTAKRLLYNNLLDYLPLSDDYSIAEIKPLKNMEGKSLKELGFRRKFHLSIIAVQDLSNDQMLFTPGPGYCVKPNDSLKVLGKIEDIDAYNNIINK